MAYKFNNGRGGVICDQCKILIDQDISLKEYEATYGISGDDGDFCMKCKTGKVAIIGSRSASRADVPSGIGGSNPSPSARKQEVDK